MLIFRYLLLGGDNILDAVLEAGIGTANGKAAEIKTNLSAGVAVLDVDNSGGTPNTDDVVLIFRYLLLGGDTILDAVLEAGISTATGRATEIKAAIAALL